jgi:hypothetical protein
MSNTLTQILIVGKLVADMQTVTGPPQAEQYGN